MSEDVQEGEKTGHVLGCSRLRAEGFGEHQTPGLHTRAGERYGAKSERCSGGGTSRTGHLPGLLAGWGAVPTSGRPQGGGRQVDEHTCAFRGWAEGWAVPGVEAAQSMDVQLGRPLRHEEPSPGGHVLWPPPPGLQT